MDCTGTPFADSDFAWLVKHFRLAGDTHSYLAEMAPTEEIEAQMDKIGNLLLEIHEELETRRARAQKVLECLPPECRRQG